MNFTAFDQIIHLLPSLSPADKAALIERLRVEEASPVVAHLPSLVGLYMDDAPSLTLQDIQAILQED